MLRQWFSVLIFSLLSSVSCKENKTNIIEQKQSTEASTELKKPTIVVPVIVPAPTTLGENATTLFNSQPESTLIAQWNIKEEEVFLRAEFDKSEPKKESYQVKVIGFFKQGKGKEQTKDKETTLMTCDALIPKHNGHINLVLRGEKLHILCINSPWKEEVGSTDALRFSFDLDKRVFTKSGSYGGDGELDLDTIDLDENELF